MSYKDTPIRRSSSLWQNSIPFANTIVSLMMTNDDKCLRECDFIRFQPESKIIFDHAKPAAIFGMGSCEQPLADGFTLGGLPVYYFI